MYRKIPWLRTKEKTRQIESDRSPEGAASRGACRSTDPSLGNETRDRGWISGYLDTTPPPVSLYPLCFTLSQLKCTKINLKTIYTQAICFLHNEYTQFLVLIVAGNTEQKSGKLSINSILWKYVKLFCCSSMLNLLLTSNKQWIDSWHTGYQEVTYMYVR